MRIDMPRYNKIQRKLTTPFSKRKKAKIHKIILGIEKIIDKNKIIEASKSTILDKSPEKINKPFTNKSPPKKIKNMAIILALKESESNINAEKISKTPRNFSIMRLVIF